MSYIILKYIDFYYIFIIKLMAASTIYAPLVYVTQSGQIIPSGLGTPKNLTQSSFASCK